MNPTKLLSMENRLDPFFRGKLTSHETPFTEEHWIQMQVLLKEQKRKKKRIFFWLVFGTLLSIGLGTWLILTTIDHKDPNEFKLPEKTTGGSLKKYDANTAPSLQNSQKQAGKVIANNPDDLSPYVAPVSPKSNKNTAPIIAVSKSKWKKPGAGSNGNNASPDENEEKRIGSLATVSVENKDTHSGADSMHSNPSVLPVAPDHHFHQIEMVLMPLGSKSMEGLYAPILPLALQNPGVRTKQSKRLWEFYLGAGAVAVGKELSTPGVRLEIGVLKKMHQLGMWSVGAGMEWWMHSPAAAASSVKEVKYGFGRTEYTYELKPTDLRVLYAQVLWHVRLQQWQLHLGPQMRYLPLQKSQLNTYTASSFSPDNTLLRSEQGYQTTSELQLRRWLPGLQAGIQYRWKQWELAGSAIWMNGTWLVPTNEAAPNGPTFTFQSQLRYYFKWKK